MSDPGALRMVIDAHHAYEILGSPEGDLVLYQAVIYLASAPKSNSVYKAQKNVEHIKEMYLSPQIYSLNSPKGYVYDHDLDDAFSGMNYFPQGMKRTKLYHPVERGFERDIKKRLEYWEKLRAEKQ
jgi:putative ATPase